MQNKNIIIGILSGIILIGVLYIYQLSNRTVVLEDVDVLESPFNLGTKIATTAPPYVASEPDEPVASTTQQTGKIDEHLTINPTLREVNFCGNTYKVKQVMIDGVDVVQRIAEIAGDNIKVESFPQYVGTGEICKNIKENYQINSELKFSGHKAFSNNSKKDIDYTTGIDYPEIVGTLYQFDISTTRNTIYLLGEEGGDYVQRIPIGVLKK